MRRQLECLASVAGRHEFVAILDRGCRAAQLDEVLAGLETSWVWAGNNLLSNALVLSPAAKQLGLDVLVCQNFAPLRTPCASVAVVYDILFRDFPEYYTAVERAYFAPLRFLARRATRLLTISRTEKDRLVSWRYGTDDRIDVAYPGVDSRFRVRAQHDEEVLRRTASRLGLPDRFMLFVGRLNARKNIERLIEALPLLRDPGIPLVVVGDPDWKVSAAPERVRALNLDARVRFVGGVDDADLPSVYALATLFVFPSLAEGFGLPPLEAMASGVPCVVSNATALPEVCGDAARYVDARSPASIAAGIDDVLGSSDLRGSLERRGVARAAEFTWRASAAALVAAAERAFEIWSAA